jgi:hypothetical protein
MYTRSIHIFGGSAAAMAYSAFASMISIQTTMGPVPPQLNFENSNQVKKTQLISENSYQVK